MKICKEEYKAVFYIKYIKDNCSWWNENTRCSKFIQNSVMSQHQLYGKKSKNNLNIMHQSSGVLFLESIWHPYNMAYLLSLYR